MNVGASFGPLQGIRVLDLGIWRPVPYATQLLAEMGADIIKVEPPGGDPMRVFPDLFAVLNAGKRAVAVDLKDDKQRDAVLALARDADAVLEGFRPGVVDRLGVGYDDVRAVNPRVVYCSVSGYGQTGPRRDAPGHDVNYQGVAGLLGSRSAEAEPTVAATPVADIAGGVYAAMAVCAALVRAARADAGDYIDVAMADVLATWTGPLPALHLEDGQRMQGGAAGYGVFRTADNRWLALGVLAEQPLWSALVRSLGLDELADLTFKERSADVSSLNARVGAEIARRPRNEVVTLLAGAGVPASPVLAPDELADDPQLQARGVVHRNVHGVTEMRHPLQYARHPAQRLQGVPSLRSGIEAIPSWG